MRSRFYRQQTKWSSAISNAYEMQCNLTVTDLSAIQALSEGLRRGWVAMATQAAQNGAKPIDAEVWEMRLHDGSKGAMVRSAAEARHLVETGRDEGTYVAVWTLDEIVNVIAINLGAAVVEAKIAKQAPKEKLDTSWIKHGDAIPFGDNPTGSVGGHAVSVDVLADFD